MRVLVVQSAPKILPAMMTFLTIYLVTLVAVGAVVLGAMPLNLTHLCPLHSAQDIDDFCGKTAHARIWSFPNKLGTSENELRAGESGR